MTNLGTITLSDAWQHTRSREFFLNTWPMYVHELRGFGATFYTLDASGQWLPRISPDWVARVTPNTNLRASHSADDARQPFQRTHVIEHLGRPAGFACVGTGPFKYMPEDCDYGLAEFFMIHEQRGAGMSQRAVELVLQNYPAGRWHLRVLPGNARARRFWKRTLPALDVRELEERVEGSDVSFRFDTRSA